MCSWLSVKSAIIIRMADLTDSVLSIYSQCLNKLKMYTARNGWDIATTKRHSHMTGKGKPLYQISCYHSALCAKLQQNDSLCGSSVDNN